MKFHIGEGSTIFMGCSFDRTEGLTLGTNSVINANCRIDTRGGVTIGDNVSISSDVIILTADHDMNDNMVGRQRAVFIEDYVWVGTKALILPGVTIGQGGVAAAGALISKNIGPLDVVAGVPAKFIKKRSASFDYNSSYKRLFQ